MIESLRVGDNFVALSEFDLFELDTYPSRCVTISQGDSLTIADSTRTHLKFVSSSGCVGYIAKPGKHLSRFWNQMIHARLSQLFF